MKKPDYIDNEQPYKKLSEVESDFLYLYKKLQVLDENIKDIDKEVKDLKEQLLERLRKNERRDEANDDIEVLYDFGTYAEVK